MNPRAPASPFASGAARILFDPDADAAPLHQAGHLDALWFQVTGTICNIRCAHCFITCGPTNRSFGLLPLEEVERRLEESVPLGVREYYFTGGEPFLHPQIVAILASALEYGPTTVLTNGMLLKPRHLIPLSAAVAASRYSLEFRISIDGFDAARHDSLRGEGSFDATMNGLQLLIEYGFLPIVTAVQTWTPGEEPAVYRRFVRMLQAHGYENPRIKLMPVLKMGAEAERTGGYPPGEELTNAMLADFDLGRLICSSSRIVTDRGIRVCPILIEEPASDLGDDLAAAAETPFRLEHAACTTCYLHGAICSNAGGMPLETPVPGNGGAM